MTDKQIIVYQELRENQTEMVRGEKRTKRNIFKRQFGCMDELQTFEETADDLDSLVIGVLIKLKDYGDNPTDYSVKNLDLNGDYPLASAEASIRFQCQVPCAIRLPISDVEYRRFEKFFKECARNYIPC